MSGPGPRVGDPLTIRDENGQFAHWRPTTEDFFARFLQRRTDKGDGGDGGMPARGASLSAEWWSIADAACYLGVRASTISAYRFRGRFPPPGMIVGRTAMWRPQAIVDWQKSRPRAGR